MLDVHEIKWYSIDTKYGSSPEFNDTSNYYFFTRKEIDLLSVGTRCIICIFIFHLHIGKVE